ncbi:MAG: sigma-54-dependent Fis family transcriptional regulator, partial [Alphaproteobacteria bacterium]|nr:sigma-54-dependent Fis family transcriptional regulator [Alphaproteobacteria bacterium]
LSQSAMGAQPQKASHDGDPGEQAVGGSTLDDAERQLITGALRGARGNASEAARALGVTRMALRYRIEKHGLRASDFRDG